MTVWVVNPFDNLPLEGNRPQRYWLMSKAFAAAGCKVRFWTSDFSHATKRKRIVKGDNASGDGFAVTMIPTLPYPANVCLSRIRSHARLAKDFERMARDMITSGERPDLIVASTPPLGLCSAALAVARSCGARFVCDIQDAWPETFWRLLPRGLGWSGGFLFAGMRHTARRLYREADVVTGVCSRYRELSGRGDFHLAYHGIETDFEDGRNERGKKDGDPMRRLVYVGNLGAGYDLGTVIVALSRRSDLTLDIAGLGPRERELREMARRFGVENRVRFHGYLDSSAMRRVMASCDVGVIPMRDDSWVGLPYKLADYLKAGLMVVSSLHGECGELLERTGYGRTYEWQSVESLLSALDSLTPTSVSLPDELKAEHIYRQYVERVRQ